MPDVGGRDPAVEVAVKALEEWWREGDFPDHEADDDDRSMAEAVVVALRSAGVLSPGQPSLDREEMEAARYRAVLADTGMKLALMVDALASQGQDPSELEAELLNPIQRVLGAHESSTPPRSAPRETREGE
jgi:hypothetical protein